jgi:SAM-dependent methyltransferase
MKEILDSFDAIYVINLDSRPDRLTSFVDQLKLAGVSAEYINKKIKRFSAIVNENGARGCILSHVSIIREAKLNGYSNVLVFEDDMMYIGSPGDSNKITSQLKTKKWDVFYLGYNSHEPLNSVDFNILNIKNCFSTHAIAYNNSVYDFILESVDSIKIFDVWLRDVVQHKFACLGAYPIQCSQVAGRSDIENKDVNYDFIMERFNENTKHLVQRIFMSICIPAYEMNGKGFEFLDFNLSKIYEQSYNNLEVVVSDQSNDYSVMRACAKWSEKLKIVYAKSKKRGSSSNINKAMQCATGEFIKIVFQDDFLYHKDSLRIIVDNIKPETKWLTTGCEHTTDGKTFIRPFYPVWNDRIREGINTISSPSVITIKNSNILLFDEELLNLMDTDYYYRLKMRYGLPTIVRDLSIVNRVHPDSVSSSMVDESLMKKELAYVEKKYNQVDTPIDDKSQLVSDRGYWFISDPNTTEHSFDENLSAAITSYLIGQKCNSILDIGCGLGEYCDKFIEAGMYCEGYDGNPHTEAFTNGKYKVLDFSESVDLGRTFDWVISLEVGEHIPREFENNFFGNIERHAAKGAIISWAVEGQDGLGHVNCRNNDYVKTIMYTHGFRPIYTAERFLRNSISLSWFKNTIMAFEKISKK